MKKIMILLSICLALLVVTNIYQKIMVDQNKKIVEKANKNLTKEQKKLKESNKILEEIIDKNKDKILEFELWQERNKELEVLVR